LARVGDPLDGGARQLSSSTLLGYGDANFQALLEDGERVFCRIGSHVSADGYVLTVLPAAEHPAPATLDRLAHEYNLREELDGAWAVRPLELIREGGRTTLVLEDPGGEPLARLLGGPFEIGLFLRLAIDISVAVGRLHRRGLLHKDIKPANIMVNCADGQARLTGFGIASRVLRERQAPDPPETIAGTLAYMAPEQTGRMNRSIDSRSDLYALGVTFYQMLTGSLPFTVADPMEWVHCHIARKPLPPGERLENIPAPVSEIIVKLLAKTAEERYQTAAGVESDLRRCLAEWERKAGIAPFALGEHDAPDRLLLPEKLYGRAHETATLLSCFDRMVNGGAPELVLVSGYSGIGKSSVVHELHKVLVPPRGLFASGKFDQYKRDIPYSTLVQAFQSLVRPLLGKSDTELRGWREALLDALGPNGRLIVDLVPELNLIIGDQPPVPALSPQDAQRRFQMVVQRFIGVFARPEHPLALFLDDLQWLDAATLDLLENLLIRSGLQHLMLIGAYRANEVDAAHPLRCKLDSIKTAGGKIAEITLGPIAREDLGQLIAEALRCEPIRAAPLAQLVYDKTGGNPFFAIQFVSSLAEEKILFFDHEAARWSWNLDRIHARGYTDNVVDLLVRKLTRLPVKVRNALQRLACLGNSADVITLALVHGTSEEQVHADLSEATRHEFVERLPGAYRFVHDRVQEAAYALITEDLRARMHLQIGQLLVAHTPPDRRQEKIFEIVNQLDRGVALMVSQGEREQLAELNLIAGQRAKSSTAYASALKYVAAGAALMAEDGWKRRRELVFALELLRAECEFLTGELAAAKERLAALSMRAANTVERAAVTCLRMNVHTTLGKNSEAVGVGLDYLRHLGIEWSPHPSQKEARHEYDRIWTRLGQREIEDLLELPLMSDPASLATIDVLARLGPPAIFTDMNLYVLIACGAVNLSLERGNCDASCGAYIQLGMTTGAHFGDYQAGYRFGRLGYVLTERRGLKRYQGNFGHCVLPWTKHVKTGRDLVHGAIASAMQTGDLTYAAFSSGHLNSNMLAAGDALIDVQREAERGLAFVRKARFGFYADVIATQLALVRTLRGLTRRFGSFDDEEFNEVQIAGRLSSNPNLAIAECWYWIRKLQACFLAGDHTTAVQASLEAQRLLWTSSFLFESAEYHFYSALSRAASCDLVPAGQRQQQLDAIAVHQRQLHVWAENCPENFENRAALIDAEIARIEGRALDAEQLYEQAIRSARENAFVHNEAIAYELAARFYEARGFRQFAYLYLRNARQAYLHWGAIGKVRQLDETYPELRQEESLPGPTSTIGAPVEQLDLATVIKVSQAVSGEIALESLIDTFLCTAMAQAGAERALLIMPSGQEFRIDAEATTSGDKVTVHLVDEAVTERALPESVLHYVLRTREIVILDDAAAQSPFGVDPYIHQRQARSILCLPLLNRAKLIGVLYLENNLTPRVFAPTRIPVLKLLASQAAVALENARLYRDVAESEAKIRRLVDSNIIGIFIWDFDGRILEANDEFLRMVSYEREDLVSGRIRWADLTPPDWRERNNARIEQQKNSGRFEPFEKEFTRKDDSRVPVLIGGATFEEGGSQGVAFVLDLTERKRAEQALQESEYKLRQIIDTVPGFLWTADPGFQPTYLNQPLLEYYGTGFEDFRQRGWQAFLHPDDVAETAKALSRAFETGTTFQAVHRLRRADGRFRWHRSRGEPLRDQQGSIIQWYGLSVDIDEAKKAEDRLRRSEAYLAEAQRLGHSGVAAYNETTILYGSEEIFRIWGFDPAQGIPSRETVLQRVHPGDRERLNAEVRRAVGEKRGYSIGYRLVMPDGTVKHLEAIGQPVFSATGELIEIVTTQVDVTERKQADEALRESEARLAEARRELQATVDKIPALVASLWPNGQRDFVNLAWQRFTGISQEEARGTTQMIPVHPDHRGLDARHWQRCLETGEPFEQEEQLLRVDGQYRWHWVRREPARDENGNVIKWYGIGFDIEDRKCAENALRESEAKFRDYAETASDWFWETGPDYRFTLLTENAFNAPAADRLGTASWDHALDLEAEPEKWRLIRATLDSRKPFRDFVYRGLSGNGSPMYVRASGKPVFGADGEFRGYRGTGADVTALRTAEAEARESERRYREAQLELAHANRVATMGQLTASIAHEVNQPITAAITYALAARRWLGAEPPNFREVDDALSLIVKEGNRAGDVVGRIRALIEKAPARKDAVAINDAILEVIALTRTQAANNTVRVRTQLAKDLPSLQGDRVQLQQVLLNLIINAIEAMRDVGEEARELLVSTRHEPDGVSVEVRDTGPGFAPNALERLFEAFYTTKPGGLGLGLSICRSIIEAHDGRLWASPNAPRGAVFGFVVPAHPAARRPMRARGGRQSGGPQDPPS
jgi:PAS domain S-box-containing protein